MPAPKGKKPSKKPVQVSLDQRLLKELDRQTGKRGRSAFITQAILLLLRARQERAIDEQLRAAYEGKADELWAEVKPWIDEQVWSPDDELVTRAPAPARKRAARG